MGTTRQYPTVVVTVELPPMIKVQLHNILTDACNTTVLL